MMNRMPMFSLPTKESSPKGITATTTRVGTNRTIGARLNTGRSASSGTVSSLVISFTESAMGCNRPKGPHRLGRASTGNGRSRVSQTRCSKPSR